LWDRLCAYLLHDIRSASLHMISASSEDDATPKSPAVKSQESPPPSLCTIDAASQPAVPSNLMKRKICWIMAMRTSIAWPAPDENLQTKATEIWRPGIALSKNSKPNISIPLFF